MLLCNHQMNLECILNFLIFRVLQSLENEFASLKEEMVISAFCKYFSTAFYFGKEPICELWPFLDRNDITTSRIQTI